MTRTGRRGRACGLCLALAGCLGPEDAPGVGQSLDTALASGSSRDDGTEQTSVAPEPEPPARASASGAAVDGSGDGSGNEADSGGPPFDPQALVVAAIGDYGTAYRSSAQVGELVASWNPDHVLTTGDNNYSVGAASTIDDHIGQHYSAFIGGYTGDYGPGAKTNRFWPSPGNHDWGTPDLAPYRDYFTLPGNERYYDIDLGVVHLFAIDSDVHEPDGKTADSVQAQWLQSALAASTACWKLVYFHHPAYSSGAHGSDLSMRWPFEAWGADAVLAGHDHTYERLQVGGIPYFVTGLGGRSIYAFGAALPETQARYNEDYGAMVLAITTTDLTFEFFTIDGQLVDQHTVDKDCGP